ncbi:hypothetical protein HK104_009164 [Borealophlyctis nickersoniae]|nr:hypothetical protein HK104_009164 [Borealophlyctis nickersoniae]
MAAGQHLRQMFTKNGCNSLAHCTSLTYQGTSTSAGLKDAVSHANEFSGSDVDFMPAQLNGTDLVVIPAIAGMIVIAYNLPNMTASLTLTRQNVVDIFTGRILTWDDPLLLSNNPSLKANLPAGFSPQIYLVMRKGGSGTTYNFMSALHSFDPTFAAPSEDLLSLNITSKNPNVYYARTSVELLGIVAAVPYTLSYVNGHEALGRSTTESDDSVRAANIINRNGDVVKPEPISAEAAQGAGIDVKNTIDSPNPGAYPMTVYTYYGRNNTLADDIDTARWTLRYLWWTINRGNETAIANNFSPLLLPAANSANVRLSQITFNSERISNLSVCDLEPGTPGGCQHGSCLLDLPFQSPDTIESENHLTIKRSEPFSVIAISITMIGMTTVLGLWVLIYAYRDRPAIKAIAPATCYTVMGGSMIVLWAGVWYTLEPNSALCNVRLFWAPTGSGIVFSMLFLKMYRIYAAFGFKNASPSMKDATLICESIAAGLVEVVIIAIWAAVTRPQATTYVLLDGSQFRTCVANASMRGVYKAFEYGVLFLNVALMIACLYLGVKTRNAHAQFAESKSIAVAVSMVLLLNLFGLPVAFTVSSNPETLPAAHFLRTMIFVLSGIFVPPILYAPRLVEAIADQKKTIKATLEDMGSLHEYGIGSGRGGGRNSVQSDELGEQSGNGDSPAFNSFIFVTRVRPNCDGAIFKASTLVIIPELDCMTFYESISAGKVTEAHKMSTAIYQLPNLAQIPTRTVAEQQEAARVVFKPPGSSTNGMVIEFASIERVQAFRGVLQKAAISLAGLRRGAKKPSRMESDNDFLRVAELRLGMRRVKFSGARSFNDKISITRSYSES